MGAVEVNLAFQEVIVPSGLLEVPVDDSGLLGNRGLE